LAWANHNGPGRALARLISVEPAIELSGEEDCVTSFAGRGEEFFAGFAESIFRQMNLKS
jgi:hypothetical protein